MTARAVVIGDALIDELVAADGSSAHLVGGSALNVAVGLGILGVPATLIAMIGDDDDGALIRAHLAAHGVTLLPTLTPDGTGVARSERIGGEPRYSFSASMVARALEFDPEQRAAIAAAELVAVSGFPFDVHEQVALLAAAVNAHHPVVAVDPNPRAGLLHDAVAYRENLESFADSTQLLKIGDEDVRLLYGASIAEIAPRLLARFPYLLTTEGRDGAAMRIGSAHWHRPALVGPDAVVDTMGAGDAVFASVLAQIIATGLDRIDWDDALARAMRIAAATIAHPGALLRLPD